ncbi:MAG: putative transcriptional regulator [Anaerocolumna sp.]|jgi:transcriptional regulator with XRE-family HTH domain|nr:putative transcriptional regulator [Anaerocolumna sp.]
MPLNMIIREKRKEIGLTQEQIAEYLGVSTPAVNKWEKGITYPDIALLPPLARLLKVDLNTLLCFNEGLTEQEISQFSKDVITTIRNSCFSDGFHMAMKKIQDYPNCYELIHTAALLLDGALLLYGANITNKESYETEIITLYERVIKSNDEQVRNKAIYMLVSKYMGRMEYDRAQEMLDLLPDRTALDKKQLQSNLMINQGKFSEAAELLERKLLMGVSEIQNILMSLTEIELKEGNIQNATYLADTSRQLTTLFQLWDINSFIAPLQVALARKDVETSISLLKSILSAAITPWEMNKSTLYHHIAVKGNQENLGKQILPALISEVENPKYEFLHSKEEFKELIKQYRAIC